MAVCRTISEIRASLAPRRALGPVALVATMGALHEGHHSLVRIARKEASTVVVSIFVNPLQFAPGEDFGRYPRALAADLALLEEAGVDAVFTPDRAELYPEGFATRVEVGSVSEGQEGAVRPGHFTGVATVVAKLFAIVGPDVVVFGRKDLQQTAVVARMIADLNFPVRLVVGEVDREADGLARSSRNVYLTPAQRGRAAAFPRALREAREQLRGGMAVEEVEARTKQKLENEGFGVDYVEVVEPQTIRRSAEARGAAVAAAVRLGKVRLLDNVIV
jgi:pantoate--beta-alanine ligase